MKKGDMILVRNSFVLVLKRNKTWYTKLYISSNGIDIGKTQLGKQTIEKWEEYNWAQFLIYGEKDEV